MVFLVLCQILCYTDIKALIAKSVVKLSVLHRWFFYYYIERSRGSGRKLFWEVPCPEP